jgi:hypothetical protein
MTTVRSPYSGKLSPSKRELLWLREGRVCHWCRKPTRFANGCAWDTATIDHILPRYKGGTNDESNLVSACSLCNGRRSYEDQMGLPDGSLLGHYPVAKQHGVQRTRRAAMLRHAFNIPTPKGTQPVAKSIFDSESAYYSRSQSGNDKTYRFDIEEMSTEQRQLLGEAEAILFRLATSDPEDQHPTEGEATQAAKARRACRHPRRDYGTAQRDRRRREWKLALTRETVHAARRAGKN